MTKQEKEAAEAAALLQRQVGEVVRNFTVDGSSDYGRMDAAVHTATGLRLDNDSLWELINRAKGTGVKRIAFSLDA